MRLLAPLSACILAASACAADVTIGHWNGMLLVTAPAGHDLSRLGGRLDQRITLDAREQPLTETADFLREATRLNIVVAPALLANPPLVSMQVREMALGNVLKWLERTAAVHVGFVSGALYISDLPVAGASSTRLYDVSDLAMPIRNFPGPELSVPQPGGTGSVVLPAVETDDGATRYDLDQLTDMLNRLVSKQ